MESSTEHSREFVRLLTGHQEALRSLILALVPNVSDVRDVLQEVNVVLWEKRESFEIGSNFGAWAATVARYKVMNYRKRMKREGWLVFSDDVVELLADGSGERQSALFEAKRGALAQCLEKVSPGNRDLLMTRYGGAQSIESLAAETGRSAPVLRVTLHRVRAMLRKCVSDRLQMEGQAG
ncbi:sigma-70 family RNA polymerase sigma factor [Sulfuriroseicoccus oceanibius]|uniref:Sigma-70 family RNA polymerase sigma factor n=1 Tax=Sulfuriroseicoccus oceanibius TaxID=2707525 RepID=A0A6B3LCQ4_9BACT|nr:sigma-70 family RNA polymerase sigma factor [Sulfuriroseicoccus oceanibius]QQL44667.1 sigma-70 family RNA polymerase sigma factor [Sulfuriroseicoccus oceanibius]